MLSEVRNGILKPLASDHAPNTGLKQKDEKENDDMMRPYCSFVPPRDVT